MFRIGVLVSGGGTNLQAIIDRIEDGYLSNCEITSVVSSKEGVFALERAKKHGISARCIARKAYSNTEEYSSALAAHFEQENVDLIVLAGFLIGRQISRIFYNHDHAVVTGRTFTDRTHLHIRKRKALRAVMDIVFCVLDRAGKAVYLLLRQIDNMECQPLRRLRSDSRKFRQFFN